MGEPEPPTDESRIAKQPPDVLRVRIGRDIEILGMQAEQKIPDATADQKGLVARLVEPVQDLERVFADIRPADAVLRPRDNGRRRPRVDVVQEASAAIV
jgi:hypothetical protein